MDEHPRAETGSPCGNIRTGPSFGQRPQLYCWSLQLDQTFFANQPLGMTPPLTLMTLSGATLSGEVQFPMHQFPGGTRRSDWIAML
jgi:hypothetical protein